MDIIQKFQDLLKELFQFETSDLDFGIYRILNYKRDQIRKFIEEDLVNKVESAFARHKDERLTNINQRFEEARQELLATAKKLGEEPITPTGDLKEEFKDSELGRKYQAFKAQKNEAQTIDEIKLHVFNDLYNFFSRFYEEGDFVPQYRYSIKGHKYAIPYDGEEVKLYWANQDQYYTKTGLLFRDYTFKANDYKVIFRIVSAREELGSKKATKERFFILDDESPLEQPDNKTVIIRFQYRELTEEEVKSYQVEGGSNTSKQKKINQRSYDEVLNKVKDIELKTRLGKDYKNEKPLLLYQISRFTAKNTKDYFIHKDLKKFLSEQLDYFIKAEVLTIGTLEKERFLDKHITRAKVVREIGEDIIDFLSQIEDFQKRFWEKKKFVLSTEYVITTDRLPEEFYDEIWKNREQKKEWEELGFETLKSKAELKSKKLPIDTKCFSQEFKEKLLERLTEKADLDDLLDGLLIKSENWQALNLLLGKYGEKVQTIYIDPPFNKEQDANYLYNVKYKDSTWVSLLENRLSLARNLINDKASIFVRCDYNGNMYVRMLMNEVFGKENFRDEIIVNRTQEFFKFAKGLNKFMVDVDSFYFYAKSRAALFQDYRIKRKDEAWWAPFLPGEPKDDSDKYRIVLGKTIKAPQGRKWGLTQDSIYKLENEVPKRIKIVDGKVLYSPLWTTLKNNWTSIGPGYSRTWGFPTENTELILRPVIESTSNNGDFIMDFFLGIGTTTAVAHKLKRKWIGVEMGPHFDRFETDKGPSGLLIRMKEVLAGEGNHELCGISKEVNWQGGGFFKYQILEQYEDTLDNIELTPNKQAELKFGDDYLLKYFLDYETRENPNLLNIEHLKSPFSYKLKVNLEEVGEPKEMIVDIPETFNYLLGLKVKKTKIRNKRRKYMFILGEKEGKNIAIVWREYEDIWNEDDFKRDKEFIIQELQPWTPHIVYVNGQSILTRKLGERPVDIHYIEPKFKKLMG